MTMLSNGPLMAPQGQFGFPGMGGGTDMGIESIMPLLQQAMIPGMQGPIQTTPEVSPIISPLDMWSYKKFGVTADRLQGDDLESLIDHMIENADDDEDYWEPRNDRFMDSQKYWEVGSRYGEDRKNGISTPTVQVGENVVDEVGVSESIELNDGYLTVDKITSMISGAAWGIDVPPKDTTYDDKAQDIEDFLRWMESEFEVKHASGLGATIIHDEVQYAALRGWICGIITPDPKNTHCPVKYVLEDPMVVFPRYSGDEMVRVERRYTISALEAQVSFPSAFEFLLDYKEDDQLEVTEYYDKIYRLSVLSNGGSAKRSSAQGRVIIQPLSKHGYIDINGYPINPWIIITPRGSPTRHFSSKNITADKKKVAAYIGLDVLYPIKGLIDHMEKLASMQMTEVAKGVNPPHVVFMDGVNPPARIDMSIGAENYLVYQQQDIKILETSSMKPDAQPLLTLLTDRLQKGSIPGVLYGQSTGALAGYAISLLTQQAQDVVRPILDGVKLYREMRFRRMLEMYVVHGSQFSGALPFAATSPTNDQMYTGMKTIDPATIRENGVHVVVSYDEVLPRDMGAMVASAVSANQAGMLPLYDAMKMIGIKDVKQAMQRLAEGLNYQDPLVQKWLARLAGSLSGNELLKQATMMAHIEEQQIMMMQQQMAEQEAAMKSQGGGKHGAAPMEESPPSRENPITAATNQMNNAGASMNVGNGATPPNPEASILQFLGG